MQRTYGRKGTKRHSRAAERSLESSPERPETSPRKRQKLQVEVSLPATTPSPVRRPKGKEFLKHETHASAATNFTVKAIALPAPSRDASPTPPELSSKRKPRSSQRHSTNSSTTALLPLKRSETDPSAPPRRPPVSASSETAAKDLFDLFDLSQPALKSSKPKSTGGVAKSMLRRTRTESSIDSVSPSGSTKSILDPSPSKPLTPRKLAPTRSDTILDFGNPTGISSNSRPLTPSKSQSLEDIGSPSANASARPSLVGNSKRTYAGKSRSYLIALPPTHAASLSRNTSSSGSQSQSHGLLNEDADMGTTQDYVDDLEVRESYSDLRARWGVDNSEDDPYPPFSPQGSPGDESKRKGKGKQQYAPRLPNGMMNDLKSISELRSKGETRRFFDEMGYLFEGLDPKGAVGVRRGSAMEIVTKLCDAEFARKAKAADFFGRAWEVLRQAGAGDGDKVLDTILVFFAALVSRDPNDLSDLASKSDFTSALYRMLEGLERDNDPLWLISSGVTDVDLKKLGIAKIEKALLIGLRNMIRKQSALFDSDDIISNRLLISQALSVLPSHLQPSSQFTRIVATLISEIRPLPSRLSAYMSGLALFPPLSSSSHLETPSLQHIDNCLRLVDSFLLGRWADDEEETTLDLRTYVAKRDDDLSAGLVATCIVADILLRSPDLKDQRATATKCMESVVRVLINLTHDNLAWCRSILNNSMALPTIIHLVVMSQRQRVNLAAKPEPHATAGDMEEEDSAASVVDRLCLALGLLTNIVQVTAEGRELCREILLDPQCPGKRNCTGTCNCPSRVNALECLAQVYLQHEKSDNELDSVVYGHIAVIFGLLMRGSPSNQSTLLRALPGTSDKKKLASLVESAREFTLFYVEFTKKLSAASQGQDEDVDEDRDEGQNTGVARPPRDAKGETVARDIISFLEDLRDRTRF